MSEVLAIITASTPRRVVAVGLVACLGGLLIGLGLFRPPQAFSGRLFLLVLGGGFLALADVQRRATAVWLELTAEELRDSRGRVLARVEDIASVDRGVFAFKPANGFLVRLKRPAPRGWAPGLWWRVGSRLGIGGVVSKTEGRHMADTLTALVAARPPR